MRRSMSPRNSPPKASTSRVIDPRTLQPLDTATIIESVRKTNRVIVVHEAVRFGGLGAEVAAQIQEEAFDHLDAPVGRLAAPFSPGAIQPGRSRAHYLPSANDIEQAIRDIVAPPGGLTRWRPLRRRRAHRSRLAPQTVGIIVNPHAGKDIRRLVSAAGQTSDAVKISILRRVAAGAIEQGAERILMSTDTHHLAERAAEGLDGPIEFLESPQTGSFLDTNAAARSMWKAEAGAVGCARWRRARAAMSRPGGPRHHSSLFRPAPTTCSRPPSTAPLPGWPRASLRVGRSRELRSPPPPNACQSELMTRTVTPCSTRTPLVEAALVDTAFVGARAVSDPATIQWVVACIASPASTGLASIAGRVHPIERNGPGGVLLRLGPGGRRIRGPTLAGHVLDARGSHRSNHSPRASMSNSSAEACWPTTVNGARRCPPAPR